jgi:cytochrome c biogenesis protein CcmG/thiol:disulfide interchange protein DsbE
MKRVLIAVMAAILLVPAGAAAEERPPSPTLDPDTPWPSGLELREDLEGIGWQWGARGSAWQGGPRWLGDSAEYSAVLTYSRTGSDLRVWMEFATAEMISPWPDNVNSDWTALMELVDRLPVDGLAWELVLRWVRDDEQLCDVHHLPGGSLMVDRYSVESPGLVSVLFQQGAPIECDDAPAEPVTGPGIGGHPLYGQPAPEIDLATLDGGRMTLSELRGRPVLINFWATWATPSREEFPLMVEAYAAHSDADLEILSIIHDDTADGTRAFAEDESAMWPMLLDPDDVAWNDYLGVGMPTSFFIDPEGVVRAFSLGGFTEAGLAAQLETILP